ncbi:MAG TPA: protein-methionine-sulfoxide reductase catalytic subunit MsrP [Aeromonadales bacterium]|nr:protein-methionine-sulfoxide reductase catalytic subunit MsrP [Aeromonadales bacterium]
MLIKTSKKPDFNLKESEVTAESLYLNRRKFIQTLSASTLLATGVTAQAGILGNLFGNDEEKPLPEMKLLDFKKNKLFSTNEQQTKKFNATHYNNFYEFGLDKDLPAKRAKHFITDPWKITVEGAVNKPGVYDFDDIMKKESLEERIYRLRCVEAWSMVIPWIGFPLSSLLKKFEPNSNAKYVEFTTLKDPKRMPGQRRGYLGFSSLKWPYVEGLRMDEAMNPLAFMAVGLYGRNLPPQNGAPLRLVVPWKYGFKSIKSIVKIRFTERRPNNSWRRSAPREYGFYANVNPQVDHPRWSQASERRIIDSSLFSVKRIKTQMFNGYGDYVANMYTGMNLRKNY